MPDRASSTIPMGAMNWLNQGGPMEVSRPTNASLILGNIVPHSTTNVPVTSSTLFRTNVASLDTQESMYPSLPRRLKRHATKAAEPRVKTMRKVKKKYLMVPPVAKAWTD